MIGISMGDANGVGPEILLKSHMEGKLSGEFLAIGDLSVLKFCADHLGLNAHFHKMSSPDDYRAGMLNVLDASELSVNDISIGQLSSKTGYASLKYVEMGTQLALKKKIAALVTLPINKEAIRATVRDFSGHTGYIASLCQTSDYTMMLVSDKLIVTHVSTHVSLLEAIERVKKERILKVIRMTDDALKKMKKPSRIAVAGLNPHAGENNSFGTEDSVEIGPAVQQAIKEGINVSGPLAADTVFYLAKKGQFDAVVCMYHDQGHIPIKLLDFESAVNVTLGLPMIRTSVDHGTAFDIAYKGIASTDSFVNAYNLAQALI
jgi:4-phospho-D-threonate 3-dehydrogenase / 4-phospho-D-erythronate 3-dehydrogenase